MFVYDTFVCMYDCVFDKIKCSSKVKYIKYPTYIVLFLAWNTKGGVK